MLGINAAGWRGRTRQQREHGTSPPPSTSAQVEDERAVTVIQGGFPTIYLSVVTGSARQRVHGRVLSDDWTLGRCCDGRKPLWEAEGVGVWEERRWQKSRPIYSVITRIRPSTGDWRVASGAPLFSAFMSACDGLCSVLTFYLLMLVTIDSSGALQ